MTLPNIFGAIFDLFLSPGLIGPTIQAAWEFAA